MIDVNNILVPTDCSELSVKATEYAIKFAKQFNARLTLLLVTATEPLAVLNDYGYFSPELHQKLVVESSRRAEVQLKEFWDTLGDPDVKAQLINVKGDPFAEIVRYAKEKEVDIIIMGTRGHTGFKHILMGSVAEKVVRYSPQPVLIVKHMDYTVDIDSEE